MENAMHVVIFEVEPTDSGMECYLEIANKLKEELQTITGFISIERFQSLNNPKKLPNILSTDPSPVQVIVLPSALPKIMLINKVKIKTKTPIPTLFIKPDSI